MASSQWRKDKAERLSITSPAEMPLSSLKRSQNDRPTAAKPMTGQT